MHSPADATKKPYDNLRVQLERVDKRAVAVLLDDMLAL